MSFSGYFVQVATLSSMCVNYHGICNITSISLHLFFYTSLVLIVPHHQVGLDAWIITLLVQAPVYIFKILMPFMPFALGFLIKPWIEFNRNAGPVDVQAS